MAVRFSGNITAGISNGSISTIRLVGALGGLNNRGNVNLLSVIRGHLINVGYHNICRAPNNTVLCGTRGILRDVALSGRATRCGSLVTRGLTRGMCGTL